MLTDAKVEFGVVPKDHWNQPDWVDEPTAEAWRDWMVGEGIIYAGTQCILGPVSQNTF